MWRNAQMPLAVEDQQVSRNVRHGSELPAREVTTVPSMDAGWDLAEDEQAVADGEFGVAVRVAAKQAGIPVRGRPMTIAWLTDTEDR